MKRLKGYISIGRVFGSSEERPIRIHIEDQNSRVIDLRMTLEDFAKALMAQGDVPCCLELNISELIGKMRESKTINIPCEPWKLRSKIADKDEIIQNPEFIQNPDIQALLVSYEVDGWKGDATDFFNSHNYTPNGCNVLFVRWVDVYAE